MKKSKIGFVVILSIILNSVLALQPLGINEVKAAFPGYNGKIVFASNRSGNYDLYTINSDGTELAQLTTDPASDLNPEWSPNGEKIAYVNNQEGNFEIYVMDADGSNKTRITNNIASDTRPNWSPDGNKLIFNSNREEGRDQLYVMNADGSNVMRLTNNTGNDFRPDWSADGTKIVFASNRDEANPDLYTMNPDGSNQTRITFTEGRNNDKPSWSPDSSKIIFHSNRDGNNEIYLFDADGSNLMRLTSDPASDSYPSLSTNQSKVVFVSNRDGSNQLYIMNSDGSNQVRLTNDASSNEQPDWQPIPNTAPVLATKSLELQSGTSKSIDVLQGATDEEALSTSNIAITVQPTDGSASIESGKVKYTPSDGYVGTDHLTYQICDSFMLDQKCSTAVLSITVKPIATFSKVGDRVVENGVEKVIAQSPRPTFSGIATPGSTIKVEIHSDPIILTTTADSDGNWSVTPNQDLPPGDHTVKITATLNGVVTELDSFVLAVQQTIPNTGFNSWPAKAGGGMLLLTGFGLAYWQRRRMQGLLKFQVPQLFP